MSFKHGCKIGNLLINPQQLEIYFQVVFRKGDGLHQAICIPLSITTVKMQNLQKRKKLTLRLVNYILVDFLKGKGIELGRKYVRTRKLLGRQC